MPATWGLRAVRSWLGLVMTLHKTHLYCHRLIAQSRYSNALLHLKLKIMLWVAVLEYSVKIANFWKQKASWLLGHSVQPYLCPSCMHNWMFFLFSVTKLAACTACINFKNFIPRVNFITTMFVMCFYTMKYISQLIA